MTKVGIEDMTIYIPPYVDAEELAIKRAQEKNIPPEKLLKKVRDLRVERFSVFYQTDVVQAGTEAMLELIQRNNIDPKEIFRIYTATESSIDHAKPLGTNIIGKFEKLGYDFSHTETIELKFACVAGSYAVYDCCNYVALHPDRKVIVLCVDEAKYDLGSGAEPTQGAGAIAMLISANPSLITLDFRDVGVFTMDVKDFYRPSGKETPIVKGWLSIYAYLYSMREAFDDYKRKTREKKGYRELAERILRLKIRKKDIAEEIDWLLFHNPYGLMVEDVVSYLLIHEHRNTKIWPEILEQIGMEEPEGSGVKAYRDKVTRQQHSEFRKRFRKTELFKNFFRTKVEPSVIASRQTGNLYTGSLFLQLASLITYGKAKKGDLISFWGFGSGSGSLFYCGTLENRTDFKLKEKLSLKNRKKLTIKEYELWRNSQSVDEGKL